MHLYAQMKPLELITLFLLMGLGGIGVAKAKPSTHWAFKKLSKSQLPEIRNTSWPQNYIDHYILDKMENAALSPSKKAAPATLIRRLYYSLIGMPPSFEEVKAFESDTSSESYRTLVDHLLNSPHFGERWGRHWLDIARYSDTKGYVFEESRDYPYAYTYRDWVIRSFNKDLSYDRFLTYQIAADSLAGKEISNEHLAAMGFLTVGRRFLNREPDIIDDRIDVTFRGMMGLTVACARCHDHKYDPVPINDYYSLYGVFASSKEPGELPLLESGQDSHQSRDFKSSLLKKQQQIDTYLQNRAGEQQQADYIKRYLLAAHEGRSLGADELKKLASSRKLLQQITIRWRDALKKESVSRDPVYSAWLAFTKLPAEMFPTQSAQTWLQIKSGTVAINKSLATALDKHTPRSIEQLASLFGKVLANGQNDPQLANALNHGRVDYNSIYPLLETKGQQHVRKLRRELESIKTKHPGAPPRAMTMIDRASPREPHVFERGDPARRGARVPRQFLALVKGTERTPFSTGSGRLEMARDIASKDNPLTARVWVNRVWGHLLGQHLVSTPSDFGLRSDAPSHPELLDHLAGNFINDKWSTKKLIRSIVLSATYQQRSAFNPDDPENLHYSHANRRRMDFESMRDSILTVSGKLNREQFGRPVKIHTTDYSTRRTVYGHIERQNLPPVFRTFDFASPDVHVAKRPDTIVPQQALFMLNGKFIRDQSLALINLEEMKRLKSQSARVKYLYQRVYSRNPSNDELAEAIKFLNPAKPDEPWGFGFGQYDSGHRKVNFQTFPHLVANTLQVSAKLPHASLGWASLNRHGGHPGSGNVNAILRWRAPSTGSYDITTDIKLPSPSSDGIILSFTKGNGDAAQSWKISTGKGLSAKVKSIRMTAGESLFFIVAAGNTDAYDSFTWNPVIRKTDTGKTWHASSGFNNSLLNTDDTLWSQLAQALLAANEFVFLD